MATVCVCDDYVELLTWTCLLILLLLREDWIGQAVEEHEE